MKFAIIVGAGSGISKSVAIRFGKEGFRIGLISRNALHLEKLKNDLDALQISSDFQVADVADHKSLVSALDGLQEKYGPADLVLYNASAISVADILNQKWEEIQKCIEVCTAGAFYTAIHELPKMLKRNKGKLFFTGGGSALNGDPEWTALGIGKAGMRNLVQALSKRVKWSSVHVAQLTVCGAVNPKDTKYNPDAIAEVYWKLFQEKAGAYSAEIMY